MTQDLFSNVSSGTPVAVTGSRERIWLVDLAEGHFKPRPTEPIWKWADRHVYLSSKMSARAGRYDSSKTPWTREPQDMARNPDVREVAVMKSSRTGFTEAFLNVLRWMPQHWPGNALYAINERNLARQVSKRRIIPSLEETCRGAFTDDKNDKSLSVIALKNMDIVVSGSGSSGPFMEMWYRLMILDELENHLQTQETTTEERAESRQSDVEDGLIVKISKPEAAGGLIDMAYIRGTQKRFWVPCPRCERRILLTREGVVVSHCRTNDGTWDLERVLKEAYRICPHCQGTIEEWEKEGMVNEGIWQPTPDKERRRPPDGRFVPAEPGVESYQISDWYSLHKRLRTGHLMSRYLMAHEIQPTESRKKFFSVNHDGTPWDLTTYRIDDTSIDALKGGRVEQRQITAADGSQQVIAEVLGTQFNLSYNQDGGCLGRLPFLPALLSVHADKQKHCIKSLVFAWLSDGQRFLIDVQQWQDEMHMFEQLAKRPYWIAKAYRPKSEVDEPLYVRAGRIDCAYRPSEVYKACLKANERWGFEVWPVRGEGSTDKQGGKKLLRFDRDYVDGREITVRKFWDHEVKNNFYISRIQQRLAPRLWMPDDIPKSIYLEWTSEKFNSETKEWEHPEGSAPNDYGDCAKQTEIFWEEEGQGIRQLPCKAPRLDNSLA